MIANLPEALADGAATTLSALADGAGASAATWLLVSASGSGLGFVAQPAIVIAEAAAAVARSERSASGVPGVSMGAHSASAATAKGCPHAEHVRYNFVT